MTDIERLMEKADKDLIDLRKVIDKLRDKLAEYADIIDALAREKEALEAELGEREVNDAQ